MHTYRIETTTDDLTQDYRSIAPTTWEPASDLDEVWFVDVAPAASDAFEALLNSDSSVIAYEIVRTIVDGVITFDAAASNA